MKTPTDDFCGACHCRRRWTAFEQSHRAGVGYDVCLAGVKFGVVRRVALVVLTTLCLFIAPARAEPSPTPVPACRPVACILPPAPNALALVSEHGDWVKIDADGRVHPHGNVKLDEFSRLFWDAVSKQVPWRPSGCGGGKK